jgi:hypothetical protein
MADQKRREDRRVLRLRRETLRALDSSELEHIVGGVQNPPAECNGRGRSRYCVD